MLVTVWVVTAPLASVLRILTGYQPRSGASHTSSREL
jgi:hypothetical protein